MKGTTSLATLVAAALLAGCGGGSSGAGSSLPTTPQGSGSSNVTTGLAIHVDVGSQGSLVAKRRSQQITSDVKDLIVNVGGTPTTFELSPVLSSSCTGSSPSYTCTIAELAGNYTVAVSTSDGTNTVGYSLSQNVTVHNGTTPDALNVTLTPVAASFASGLGVSGVTLPEDGATHLVSGTAEVDDQNGDAISSPIDSVNLFGSVAVTNSPIYAVTGPSVTSSATAGAYTDAYSFTYDGSLQSSNGDRIAVTATYTKNSTTGTIETAYNATTISAPLVVDIPLARLELPQTSTAGATFGGSTYVNDSYFIAPTEALANHGVSSSLVFEDSAVSPTNDYGLVVSVYNDSTTPVVDTGNSTCGTDVYSIGTTTPGSYPTASTTTITIKAPAAWSGTPSDASCTLRIKDGTTSPISFAGLWQQLTIYPSGSLAIETSGSSRRT